ncbi:DUF6188 family protein [Curtobacterium sp. VKM Ac-1393]|uniref:DUF6188 family protein n=1 Tax=Curtobacterium sp. VKM Ac-1393 TaxID=2783814 RepID=UPI00188CC5B7|nr:DUF6188 family protein [Curtobacterium sp. VKM Ac-1393]MBF4606855.1 hypothetical protein [Curtobacterium sp. VKM Ac-1393]
MMIWMKKGKVDSLELPWFTDAMPNELPRTDQLLFEAPTRTTSDEWMIMTHNTTEPSGFATTVEGAGTLDFIGVDFLLDLRFTDGVSVQLESAFTVTDRSRGSVIVDPERKDSLLPVLRLFGTQLVRRSVEGYTLTLVFADGETLVAGPDGEFESWHVSGPKGRPVRVDPPTGSTSTGTEGDRG